MFDDARHHGLALRAAKACHARQPRISFVTQPTPSLAPSKCPVTTEFIDPYDLAFEKFRLE